MKFLPVEFVLICVAIATYETYCNNATSEKLTLYAVCVVIITSFLLIGRISQESRIKR